MPRRTRPTVAVATAVAAAVLLVATPGASAAARPTGATPPTAAPVRAAAMPEHHPDEVLVRFRSGIDRSLGDAALRRHGTARGRAVGRTGFVRVRTNGADPVVVRDALAREGAVERVELQLVRRAAALPNDPEIPAGRTYLQTLRLPQAWDVARGSSDFAIAIIDSGVDPTHPDLSGRVRAGVDLVDDDADADDGQGHGTRVAGVAAAKTDNGIGVAGAAWDASILPVRVLDDGGAGTDGDIADGIVWAVDRGAKVVNLSLGGPGRSAALESAVRYALDRDVVVVAAAGNEGAPSPNYPAAYDGVVAVGATNDAGRVVAFSQWGPWLDLVAPGVAIATTTDQGTIATATGTSFASPFVAGIAALVRVQRPTWTQAQVVEHLKAGARDAGPPGNDSAYGAGVVDAYAAVAGDVQQPVPAMAGEANEPNATPARATPLAGEQQHEMAPEEDVDWFRFDVPAGSVGELVTVTVTPPAKNQLYDIDPIVSVYDTRLRLVRSVDSVGAETPEVVEFEAAPGTSYIEVRNFNPSIGTARYRISLTRGLPIVPEAGTTVAVVRDTSPPDLASGASASAPVSITFAREMDVASLASGVRLVHGRTGASIPTSASVTNGGTTVVLSPTGTLAPGTAHHLVLDARDRTGAPVRGTVARFRTAGATPPVTLAPAPPRPAPAPAPATSSPSTAPPPAPAPARSGYWMVSAAGAVYGFGDARWLGNVPPMGAGVEAVDLEPTPTLDGYWIATSTGHLYTFGDAPYLGAVDGALAAGETVTSISATPSGRGYWMFTTRGRVIAFGDAPSLGDMSGTRLNGPVLDSIPTPSGRGYYMVASDGGIFTFGDAAFEGSMGGTRLNAPVQSLVPDSDGGGYWLVASDGGIFSFGAPFRGSMGDVRLNGPITGMVRFGNGYLMVGTDGGIFNFSDREFYGSLGDHPPPSPIASVAVAEG